MSVTKKDISNSTDMKWYIFQLVLWGFFLVCILLIPILLLFFSKSPPLFFIIIHPLISICCFWSIIYNVFQVIYLYRFAKKATVADSTLDDPHVTWGRRVYFCITVETADGQLLAFESKAIYGHALCKPRFDDYHNKSVKVAYNEEENRIVVLSVIEP